MLSPIEKILFVIATLASLYFTYRGVQQIIRHIASGQGKIDWSLITKRVGELILKVGLFQPVFRFRLWPSILHALIGWGLFVFLMVDLSELIYGMTKFRLLDQGGIIGDIYRLMADIANTAIIVSIVALVIRRFVLRPAALSTRETTLLNLKARFGISRDSAIVATFIFTHNTMRMLGEAIYLADHGVHDTWQPVISTVAGWLSNVDPGVLLIGEHLAFWLSTGAVVAFLPYFPYSKHIHLFFAPLNFALKPERKSIGELSYINLDDQSIEQFG
ncbi:MAG: [Fe-S]-binding protein, partial [Acidobacteriota bacterium]